MFNGVNGGDTQAMEDNTGSSATPNPGQDVLPSGERDEVPDNQEVVSHEFCKRYFSSYKAYMMILGICFGRSLKKGNNRID